MVEQQKFIWKNGELIPWADAKVHVLSHALHYGFGVFEGIRCYQDAKNKPVIFRLQDHVTRLFDSAKICGIKIPYSPDQIAEACRTVIRENGLREGYIRPIAFLGEGKMGLGALNNPVHTVVATWEWGAYLGEEGVKKGIRARVSSFSRMHPNTNLARAKICGQYIVSIMAKREAMENGYEEAILLGPSGYVAEGSGENIFLVRDGVIFTPPRHSPILLGITRDSIIRIAKDMEIPLIQESFTRDELYTAEEVFMTGTAAEVTPVREVDGRTVGCGTRGLVTEKLQHRYSQIVRGKATEYASWLTAVE